MAELASIRHFYEFLSHSQGLKLRMNTALKCISQLINLGFLHQNFALAQDYLKMSIRYVNFRNLSQSPPIHDLSHLSLYPCGSRPANTSR
jgi:hypothetical protein